MANMTREDIDKGLERLGRSFMVPNIWRSDAWEVSHDHGSTSIVDYSLVGKDTADLEDYVDGRLDRDDDGKPVATLHRNVWLARLSAPGYMDCTDTTMHATEADAEEYLVETYDDGEDDDTDDDDEDA